MTENISFDSESVVTDSEKLAYTWRKLLADLEILGSDIATLGQDSLTEGQERLATEIKRVKALAADLVVKAEAEGQARRDELVTLVQANPLTSISSAFGIGFVVASIFTRRR